MLSLPTGALESLLNRHIQESSVAEDLLQSLAGRSLTVDIEGLDLRVRLAAEHARLLISTLDGECVEPATATITGSPVTMLRVLRASSTGEFRASGAHLTGDTETAEAFSELLCLARPELEEELSHLVGDVLAHEIAYSARRTAEWGSRALSALTMNVSEYLQEESRQLPTRLEVEDFYRRVERLRDDTDRATQRVERLLDATDGRAAWDGSD